MEALPDVATAFSSASKPNATFPNAITLSTDDSFSTSLTKTYDRSHETQLYRLASFDNCILYAMNIISQREYNYRMQTLTKAATDYIDRSAPKPKEEKLKAPEAKKPTEMDLLVEIRDLLKKQKPSLDSALRYSA